MSFTPTGPTLRNAAVQIHTRYLVEVVERFHFCPFAKRCREEARMRTEIIDDATPSVETLLSLAAQWETQTDIDIGFIIGVRIRWTRREFDRVIRDVRQQHQNRPQGATFAFEPFHPDADAKLDNAGTLIPYLRRSADPLLQLTRLSTLAKVREGTPKRKILVDLATLDLDEWLKNPPGLPLETSISERNHATVIRVGVPALETAIAAIHQARNEAYHAIDPTLPMR